MDTKNLIREVDFHLLDLRYSHTRINNPKAFLRMQNSITNYGQIVPALVIKEKNRFVLIDGYLRYRVLKACGRDCLRVHLVEEEPDSLINLLMRNDDRQMEAVEQAGLIQELHHRFSYSFAEIAKCLGKDKGWVKRRLDLVESLPESVMGAVMNGMVSSWAASRVLVPLSRANEQDCLELTKKIIADPLSTRELVCLYDHYKKSARTVRERIIADPQLFTRTAKEQEQQKQGKQVNDGPEGKWFQDIRIVCHILKRLQAGSGIMLMDGTAGKCIIDNTHVILSSGIGPDAIITSEMEHFGRIYNTKFEAHRLNDPNRKARVERPFHYIENNFIPGRNFRDWNDLNRQAEDWCNKVSNPKHKRSLGMSPDSAYIMEKPSLNPLPPVPPPVYNSFYRVVDIQGYIQLETNRYSVPHKLVGDRMEVQKHWDKVLIYNKQAKVAEHQRILDKKGTRTTLPKHHPPLSRKTSLQGPPKEEVLLTGKNEALDRYVKNLKARSRGRGVLVTVHLHPIFVRFALLRYREYTSEGETNESGAHLNGYSYELRVVYCLW